MKTSLSSAWLPRIVRFKPFTKFWLQNFILGAKHHVHMFGMTHYILVYLGRDMENSATKLEKFGKNRRKFDSGVGELGGIKS